MFRLVNLIFIFALAMMPSSALGQASDAKADAEAPGKTAKKAKGKKGKKVKKGKKGKKAKGKRARRKGRSRLGLLEEASPVLTDRSRG